MKLCIVITRLTITAFGSGRPALEFKHLRLKERYKKAKRSNLMNKDFTDIDPKDSAVKEDQLVYEPDHLDKLIKHNQETINMTGTLMELLVKKHHIS